MAAVMAIDNVALSTPPPPPQPVDGAVVHTVAVLAPVDPNESTSLVELLALPLSATTAIGEPLRVKRKYTKRKKPAETAPKPQKRKKRNEELQHPKRITRKVLRGVGMSRKELEEAPQKMEELQRRHIMKLEREERFKRWRASKPDLPPYMKREHPALPEVELPSDKIVQRVERKIHYELPKRCQCESCKWELRGWRKHYQYTCRVFGCKLRFDDVADFLEHQIDQHAMLAPYCRRVCEEVERYPAELLLPPMTVYIGMQHLQPGQRPTLWTMERVEEEHETLEARLSEVCYRPRHAGDASARMLWKPFLHAYDRVKQFGAAELHEQYKIALEHYESSLVFPVGPRNRQDVFATIGVGRNWLVSPEPENAERSQLLKVMGAKVVEEKKMKSIAKYGGGVSDDDETDDEVVLYEYGVMPGQAQPSEKEIMGTSLGKEDKSSRRRKEVVVSVSPSRDEMPVDESEPEVIMI